MENKRRDGVSSSLDHLFGPNKDSSSSSSSTSALLGSIFPPPPSTVAGRDSSQHGTLRKQGEGKDKSSNIYQTQTTEPCSLSSSIYYGGQENYSPRTTESHHVFKKDGGNNEDPNGSNPNSASRGNWWQGSLYY